MTTPYEAIRSSGQSWPVHMRRCFATSAGPYSSPNDVVPGSIHWEASVED